jgi:hypothetical protein
MSDFPLTFVHRPAGDAVNRLRIGHFLLWLAATAVILTAFRPAWTDGVLPSQAAGDERFLTRKQFTSLVAMATIAPVWGAAIVGLGIAGWRRVCGGPAFPVHPGHWLLLVVGSGALALLPMPELARLGSLPGEPSSRLLNFAPSAALALSLATLILATARLQSTSPWQPLFLALAISGGFMMIGFVWHAAVLQYQERSEFVLALLGFAWTMVFLFALMARSFLDFCLQHRYDALHWIGIGMVPAHFLWLIVWIWSGGNAG